MKINKIAMTTVMMLGLGVFGAQAADMGAGTVAFTGAVVDAPCNIAQDSVDQTVPFGLISKSFLNDNQEIAKNFSIKLEQCDTATLKNASITFFGPNNGTGAELAMTGQAKNVAVRLGTAGGDEVTLGTEVNSPIQDNVNTLRFVAYAKMAAGQAAVTEGEFSGIADFRMAYN